MARRWRRRLGFAALGLVAALGGGGGLGYGWLRTPAGQEALRGLVESQVNGILGEGQLTLGGLDTDLLRGATLREVQLVDGTGRSVVSLRRVEARWELRELLLRRRVTVRTLAVEGAGVDLRADADGVLDLSRMFPSEEDAGPSAGLPVDLRLESVALDLDAVGFASGGLELGLAGLRVRGAARVVGQRVEVRDLQVDARWTSPDAGALTLGGGVVWDGRDLELHALRLGVAGARVGLEGRIVEPAEDQPQLSVALRAEGVDLDRVEVLVGELGLRGVWDLEGRVDGPLSALALSAELNGAAGAAQVEGVVDLHAERLRWEATLRSEGLDVHALVDAVTEPTRLEGTLSAQGEGVSWPDDLVLRGTVSLEDSLAWGYRLPGLEGLVRVESGRATVTGLRYQTDWGAATGEGWVGEHGLDLDLDARVWRASGLAEFGAAGLEGDARARGRLQVDWSGEHTQVDFDGSLWGGALAYEDLVAWGPWRGTGVVLAYDGSGTRVEGALEAEAVRSSGVELAWVSGPFTVAVDPEGGVEYGADVQAQGTTYDSAWVGAIEGRVDGRAPAEGPSGVVVSAGVMDAAWQGYQAEQGTVGVRLEGDALALDVDLSREGEPVLGLEGGGDLASGVWVVDRLLLGAVSGVDWHNQGPLRFTLAEGGVQDAELRLRSPAGTLRLEGDLGLEGALDAQVQVERLSLAWLGGVMPEVMGGWVGSLDAEGRIGGTAQDVQLELSASALGLSVPGQVWGLNVRAQAWTQAGVLRLRGRVDDADGHLLALRAALPVRNNLEQPGLDPRGELDAELVLQPVSFARLTRALPATGELPDGDLAAQLRARGSPLEPTVALRLGLETPIGERAEWVRLDLDVESQGAEVLVHGVGAQRGAPRLELTGTLETTLPAVLRWALEGGSEPPMAALSDLVPRLSLNVNPLRLPLSSLRAFVDLPQDLEGNLRGGLNFSGRPEAPVVAGALLITEGRLGELGVNPGVLSVVPVEGGYQVGADLGFPDPRAPDRLTGLSLAGHIPFNAALPEGLDAELAREGLALELRGAGVPLEVLALFDRAVTDSKGELRLSGDIRGSLSAPRPELRAEVQGGAFTYRDLNVAFEDLQLRADIQGDRLTLERLRVKTRPTSTGLLDLDALALEGLTTAERQREEGCARGEGGFDALARSPLGAGELYMEGRSRLEGFGLADLELRLCGQRAWVSATRDMTLQMSPQLSLAGDWPELAVRGDVRTDELRLTLRESDFFGSDSLSLDPALHVARSEHAVAEARQALEQPFYHPWDIRVDIDLNRQLFLNVTLPMLDAYDALGLSTVQITDAQVDGQLALHMEGDTLDATGDLETLRGAVVVFNEDFELASGQLSFAGQEVTNPVLDILAVRDSGAYGDIAVRITQTAENPDLEFSAEGSYTLTDIMSILMLGRPTSELSDANSGALNSIMAFVTSQATGALLQKTGTGGGSLLDTVSFDTVQQGLPSVTVGSAVGDQGFLELTLNFRADEDEPDVEANLEWSFSRRLEGALYLGVGDVRTYSADLYYTRRF